MRIRRRLLLAGAVIELVVYLTGPIVAATFEIGDRVGPKIYLEFYHEAVYRLTWAVTPHESRKPRVPFFFRSELRPWFYGMYSENTDPAWVEQEYNQRQARHLAP